MTEVESGWLLPGMLLRVSDAPGEQVTVLKIERPDRVIKAATLADGQILVITPWDERLMPGTLVAIHPPQEQQAGGG